MSFETVEFTHGEIIPEVDLDQMMDNDHWNREEVNYYPIVSLSTSDICQDIGTISMGVVIDGATLVYSSAGAGNKELGDFSLNGLAVGLHSLTVTVTATTSTGAKAGSISETIKFYRSGDMNFLSLWGAISTETLDGLTQDMGVQGVKQYEVLNLTNFTVLGHRVLKSWV